MRHAPLILNCITISIALGQIKIRLAEMFSYTFCGISCMSMTYLSILCLSHSAIHCVYLSLLKDTALLRLIILTKSEPENIPIKMETIISKKAHFLFEIKQLQRNERKHRQIKSSHLLIATHFLCRLTSVATMNIQHPKN